MLSFLYAFNIDFVLYICIVCFVNVKTKPKKLIMNLTYFFPASLDEVKEYPEGSVYNQPRRGLFRTANAAISAIKEHKTECIYSVVIALIVPDHAVLDHSDPIKISILKDSQSIVSEHLNVAQLLGKSIAPSTIEA